MLGLHRLVLSGKILYPAISDTPAWIVVSANCYARQHGYSPFVLYQGLWSLMARDVEREVLRESRAHTWIIQAFPILFESINH